MALAPGATLGSDSLFPYPKPQPWESCQGGCSGWGTYKLSAQNETAPGLSPGRGPCKEPPTPGTLPFCLVPLPGPTNEGGCSAGQCHDPGEGDAHYGMVLPKAEVAHGLTHHHVPLNGQDHQRPQGNFTCKAVSYQSTHHLPGPHCPKRKRSSWMGEGRQEGHLRHSWSQDLGKRGLRF